MTTTGPRIPTPGRPSGIPTPGRSRASSTVGQHVVASSDIDYMSRAFADAIKANDPAQHRSGRVSDIPTVPSGRRSVTGRPSSVASSSSATSFTQTKIITERPKTPSIVCPPSRHSDIFTRSSSRAGKTFEVGDNVRIESLGYEGTLRYLGEIDGKLGLWAGVELSGGFAGKGKNNGTVSGKPYFTCPPDCGVFVATTKLSSPTVGPGAAHRPSSVASSRSGRITPVKSGRVTPSNATSLMSSRVALSSTSKGRSTPASGRITPSHSSGRITPNGTPAVRSRPGVLLKPASNHVHTVSASEATTNDSFIMSKITAGSRASKYLQMTAQQLNARNAQVTSPSRRMTNSPAFPHSSSSPGPLTLTSPTRPSVSPFSTPKAGVGGRTSNIGTGTSTPIKGRPSIATPRGRLPSAIAMPPPASPITSNALRPASLNDHQRKATINRETSLHAGFDGPLSDLVLSGRSPQDKGVLLISGNGLSVGMSSPRPESATSVSSADQQAHIDRLQSRVEALEHKNDQLQTTVGQAESAMSRISMLEIQLQAANHSLDERDLKLLSIEQTAENYRITLERQTCENETRLKEVESKLDDSAILVKTLQTAIEVKDGLESENKEILKAKEAELILLQARLEKAYAEMEEEKRDLGTQVDELRRAGQETIALYEERLNAADTNRYELEDKIASLEVRIRNDPQSPSLSSGSRFVSSAAQIDNEILRDQVRHLQKKIGTLEDVIEDRRTSSDKEEAVVRERMKRMKDKEDAMKRELNDGRKEVERMLKSEMNARDRVQEIEEAFRESTLALENARAEVEGLRTELANLDGISEEVAELKKSLRESRTSASTGSSDTDFLQPLQDQKLKLEAELDQLRKRLAEAEMKNARTAHDLNKEIGELEALVESKIYREDELEQELERLKDKLARNQKEFSKNSLESNDMRHRVSSTSSNNNLGGSSSSPYDQDICEICERPGHDLFNCDLLKEDTSTTMLSNADWFCEDCESYGHLAAGCPHSLDVF